jgi:hypothetical protein
MCRVTNLWLALGALLFAFVLMPRPARAHTSANCPTEPAQGVPIVSGETYYGPSCELRTTGDIDSFAFTAAAGSTWSAVLGLGPSPTANICLSLYSPTGTVVFPPPGFGCTSIRGGQDSVATPPLTLPAAGTYNLIVRETSNKAQTYAVSLEGLSPTPPDAVHLTTGKSVASEVAPRTAQDAFSFCESGTGEFEITTSVPTSSSQNACMEVYNPAGTSVAGSTCSEAPTASGCCTSIAADVYSVSEMLTPAQSAEDLVVVSEFGNDAPVDYNLEAACLLGTCPPCPPPPQVRCGVSPSYDSTSNTLTMNFTLATPSEVRWNAWLVDLDETTLAPLSGFPQSLPITEPSVTKTETARLAAAGLVGVLTTFTTPTQGITCSNFETAPTGTP